MFGGDLLYNALNVSAITTGLDTYNTAPALFNDSLLPSDFTGNKSINYYLSAPYAAASDVPIYTFLVHCRAKTYGESIAISQLVMSNINRKSYTGYYITCSLLAVIPPMNDQDNYNTPIEIILKSRT